MEVPATFEPILWVSAVGLLLYWYFNSGGRSNFWQNKSIPSVQPVSFFSALLSVKKLQHETQIDRYEKYGRVYGTNEGGTPGLSVSEPKFLRNILVKDFHLFSNRLPDVSLENPVVDKMLSVINGEDWKRIRTIITPTFSTGKIKRVLSIFQDCSKTLADNFMVYAKKGEPVDLKRLYGTFTMDVIASSAFSTKIDSHNDPNNKFVVVARNSFNQKFPWRFVLIAFFPRLSSLLGIKPFSPTAIKFFRDVTRDIITERKRTGQTRNDFLQLLMDTSKDESNEESTEICEKTESEDITRNYDGEGNVDPLFKNAYSKKSLSLDELVAQCVLFFLAGYDTTASTLSFASYQLALNPDLQEKLFKEIQATVKECDGQLTYYAIQQMKYLDNFISETLRMYPPGIRLERVAKENYQLGDTGFVIPKGMRIGVPVYAMHRDPNLFPDPDKFDPDRFSTEARAGREPYSYMPFGSGPRNCVAMRFALMEVKTCLAQVLSKFRIKSCPQTKVPLDFHNSQNMITPREVTVQLEVRTDRL